VLHTALMVTKMQLSLGCAKSSAAYDQSLSLRRRYGATDAAYVTQGCKAAGHGPRHMGLLGRVFTIDVYLEVTDVLSGLTSLAQTQISRVVQTCQAVGWHSNDDDRPSRGRPPRRADTTVRRRGADWCRPSFGNWPA